MATSLAAQLADTTRIDVDGTWQRHSAARWSRSALEGHHANGRWGTKGGFAILYLGKPTDSVVIEAYRHLVDPVEDPLPASAFAPRVLITATVAVTQILDLRTAGGRASANLTINDLTSATNDDEAYRRCRQVAQTAHQLDFHGLVAPAATKAGETLVLFTDLLPPSEKPKRSADDVAWESLPPDPRNRRGHLRAVK